jgi:formylmethanofuran dehydrogenase subunit A
MERANRARDLYLSEGFRVLSSGQDADVMIYDLEHETAGTYSRG